MRWLGLGLACLALVGCSKARDKDGPGETVTAANGVAFAYRYDFSVPSSRIGDAQEAHAQACEQLTPARCRITGMTYHLDESGQASASLDVRVVATSARTFGRQGVKAIEAAGGALTGAEIVGTDAQPAIQAAMANAADAGADRADVEDELDRSNVTSAARNELLVRRAELQRTQRESKAATVAAQTNVATTPISFTYTAGNGVGLTARLSEVAHTAYLSLTWSLATLLTLVAYLGPPAFLLFLAALFWHRLGRHWWRRAFHLDFGE